MSSASSTLTQAGTPDPLRFPAAHPVAAAGEIFAPSVALSNTLTSVILLPIAGALLLRLRGIIGTTEVGPPDPIGTLAFGYRRPPPYQDTPYSTSLGAAHATINITNNVEFLVEVEPGGESLLALTFTPAAGINPAKVISVTFLDVMQQ